MAEASRALPRAIPTPSPIAQPHHLRRREDVLSTHNRKYDIIVSEPSNPWVSGVASLFTGEFLSAGAPSPQSGGNPGAMVPDVRKSTRVSSPRLLRTLGENFPDYAVYAATGSDLLIIAGETRTLARPLAELAAMPGVSRELRRVHVNSMWDIEARRLGGKGPLRRCS